MDRYGFRYPLPACALHVASLVAWQTRRECAVSVEVPAESTRWFERTARGTWWAVDDEVGVVAARDVLDSWTVYLFRTNEPPIALVARMGSDGVGSVRERAEVLAQAYAAVLAADVYEAAQDDTVQDDVETVELPVVTVERAA